MNIANNNTVNAKQMASQNYCEGYNCAEAIVRAFRDDLNLDIPDEFLRMASGFGGGLGQAGCLCGALSGATMVLGMLKGRVNKEESRQPIYTNTQEFHRLFKEKYGVTCCRVLNPHPFGSLEHRSNCTEIIGNTSEILIEFIEKKQLAG